MPIYEYLCEACGKVNEKLQRVNDPPPSRCDECGSRKLAKLVSRSAFQLKGGGWYSDLYATPRNKGAAAAEAKDGKDGSAAAAKPATDPKPAAEAKPAAKAESAPAPAPAARKEARQKKVSKGG